jgi:hypothetical protein
MTTRENRYIAAAHLEEADLHDAHLEEAVLGRAHLVLCSSLVLC